MQHRKEEENIQGPNLLEGWGEWGTLEPCLDKTSHSPLVRAISSLMGHLNSSVRKESREVRGTGRRRDWLHCSQGKPYPRPGASLA